MKSVKSVRTVSQSDQVTGTSSGEMNVSEPKPSHPQTIDNAPLTPDEKQQFAVCEATIGKGLRTFMEVGQALQKIRELRLYRIDYITFEQYCREKWEMSSRHAERLMQAYTCVENLKCDQLVVSEPIAVPTTESCARPLTKLPAKQQTEAAKLVAQTVAKPTAKDFETAAAKVSGKQPKPIQPTLTTPKDDEVPRVKAYDASKEKQRAALSKLLDLIDPAQTQARNTENCSDVAQLLNQAAELVTAKLNRGAR